MPEPRASVPGSRNEHHTVLYALSTCIWCRRTRQLLEREGVAFDCIYVDLLKGQEREEVIAQVRHWSPSVSFPTIVVDDTRCVVGYRPEEIKEMLEL
jgi:glutaredoxin-like protein NrdH